MENGKPRPSRPSRAQIRGPEHSRETNRSRDVDRSHTRTARSHRSSTLSDVSPQGISVLEAVSKLNYTPQEPPMSVPSQVMQDHSTPNVARTRRDERPDHGVKVRERSSSRVRGRHSEDSDRKQSIRDARASSRSRSNGRPSQPIAASASIATTSMASLSRTSSITEKTRTSRRSISGLQSTKRTTQQLILLRHAARCPYGLNSKDRATQGNCPIHKKCADMKTLLSHMVHCDNDRDCPFPECTESKMFLGVIYPSRIPSLPETSLLVDTMSHRPVGNTRSEQPGSISEPVRPSPSTKDNAPPRRKDTIVKSMKNSTRATIKKDDHTLHTSRAPEEIPDVELGLGGDEALEQQSLLQEIHAQRMKLAPKVKHKAPKAPSVTSTTDSSKSAGGSGSVTRKIQHKAEEMMFALKRGEVNRSTESSLYWLKITKSVCIASGFLIILSGIVLMSLYISGNVAETHPQQTPPGTGSIPNEDRPSPSQNTPAPVSVMSVQQDGSTMSPTSFSQVLPEYTLKVIQGDSNIDELERSPQSKAYDWIRAEQQYLSDKFDPALGQSIMFEGNQWLNRFALATFYYSTSASKSKIDRSSGETIQKHTNWTHNKNWLAMGVSECEWSSYSCDGGDSLWITKNGLRGRLPPEMGLLTRLRDMAISHSPYLTGTLPSEFGLLHDLLSLNLQGNNLSGEIPPEIGQMKKVRWLYLNNNRLSGTIPWDISRASRIAFLWLSNNHLSGPLDRRLFNNEGFNYMKELLLDNNQLTGPIPDEIGMMPRVRYISINGNKFSGTIPTSLGLLTDLEILQLHNTELTGTVPEQVCGLLERGLLMTVTIDCNKVACDCGCECGDGQNELQPEASTELPTAVPTITDIKAPTTLPTGVPSSEAMRAVDTSEPTKLPTSTPTGAPSSGTSVTTETSVTRLTAEPSPVPSVELASPLITPSAGGPIMYPTDQPSSTKPILLVSTISPSPVPTYNELAVNSAPSSVPSEDASNSSIAAEVEVGGNDVDAMAEAIMQHFPDFTKQALLETDSPQWEALEWLQGDPSLNQYNIDRKLQRYAMATIFFATNGTEWIELGKWLDYAEHECDWYTTYDKGEVCITDDSGERFLTELVQWGNNLMGPIPPEISLFTKLDKIFLGVNNITSMPTEIGMLSNSLSVLNLMSCVIEGALPSELGELTNLKKMDLSENYFDGAIPSEIGRLQLDSLYLNDNLLNGGVPVEIFNAHLQSVNFAMNALTGTVPTEIGNLVNVEWMNLYGNYFEGNIPSEMGLMKSAFALHMSHNMLSGPIPSELGKLSASASLSLDLRHNKLSGTIPSELGGLTNLVVLAMDGNPELSGEMPPKICLLATGGTLETLSLDCEAVSCGHESCGVEESGGVCICPSESENETEDDGGGEGR